MTHPIHTSVIGSGNSYNSRGMKFVGFVIVATMLILSLTTGRTTPLIGIVIGLIMYEIYVFIAYPNSNFFSIKSISMDQLSKTVRYGLLATLVSLSFIAGLLTLIEYTSLNLAIPTDLSEVSSINISTLIAFALIPSILEELFFRHFFQGRLLNSFNKFVRVGVPTIVFVYAHTLTYSISLAGVLTVTVLLPLSFALAILYEETESIVPPIILHFVANLFTLSYFVVTGCATLC